MRLPWNQRRSIQYAAGYCKFNIWITYGMQLHTERYTAVYRIVARI